MAEISKYNFTIRELCNGDEPLVEEFFAAMGGESRAFFNRRGYNLRGALRALRTPDPSRRYYVFLLDGRIAAYCFFLDYDRGVPELGLAVRDDLSGRGIGHEVCRYAIDLALSEGFGGIYLTTHTANLRAQALYEDFGFKLIGPAKDSSELAYLLKLPRG